MSHTHMWRHMRVETLSRDTVGSRRHDALYQILTFFYIPGLTQSSRTIMSNSLIYLKPEYVFQYTQDVMFSCKNLKQP